MILVSIHLSLPPSHPSSPVVRDETLAEAQLPEYIHGDVHGRVVGDGERTQVQDASEAQGRGRVVGLGWSVLGEDHLGGADHALLTLPGIVCRRGGGQRESGRGRERDDVAGEGGWRRATE